MIEPSSSGRRAHQASGETLIQESMHLSKSELAALSVNTVFGNQCEILASQTIERGFACHFPDDRPRLVSSVTTMFGSSAEASSLVATAALISEEQSTKVWQVKISESGGESRVIAQVAAVYQVESKVPEGDRNSPQVNATAENLDANSKPRRVMPKPPTGTSDVAAERRRQIFEGACKVIIGKGFGDASIREIASEAGISVPLMYKHIKDKDDILYLITTECMKDILDYFKKIDLVSNKPDENLRHAIEKYIDYIGINRPYINLVYSETRSLSAENRLRIFAMERKFLAYWKKIVKDGVERGQFRQVNAELMANYIYFLCTVWSLRHWSIGHFKESEVKSTLIDFILVGLTQSAE